ncbi:MAG: phosphatase PAP2 family protein [Lachnospiraceae bacterium]|nr:phosphatase PAP2 family protein [Lachnospiraceae bacterium]
MNEIFSVLLSFDGNILLYIQENLRSEFLTPLFRFITTTGNGGLIWIAITCFLLAFKRTRKVGVMCAISLVLSLLFTNVLIKPLVARTRPYELIEGLHILIAKPHDFSFPSGHTTASFAVAWVIFRRLPKKYGIPALVYAFLMAFSRLYLGVHYPTDVLAGILLGILYATAAIWIVEHTISVRKKKANEIL